MPLRIGGIEKPSLAAWGYTSDEREKVYRLYKVKGKGREYLNCHHETYRSEAGRLMCKGTFRNGYRVGSWHNFDEQGRVTMKRFFDDRGKERMSEHYALVGNETRLHSRYITQERNGKIRERHQRYDPRGCLIADNECFNYLRPDQVCVYYVRTTCNDPWPYFGIKVEIPEGLPTYEWHDDGSEWGPEGKATWMIRRQAGYHQKRFVNGILRSRQTFLKFKTIGRVEEYDDKGRLESLRFYDLEGNPVRRWEEYDKGILTKVVSWGKVSGFFRSKFHEFYKNGVLYMTEYDSDRQRATQYYDEAGNFDHGEYVYIDENGKWHTSPIESKDGQVFY